MLEQPPLVMQDTFKEVERGINDGVYHARESQLTVKLIERELAVQTIKKYINESLRNEGKVDGKFALVGTSA